jgi:hypothetical protein
MYDLEWRFNRDLMVVAKFEVNAVTHTELNQRLAYQGREQVVGNDDLCAVLALGDAHPISVTGSDERRVAHARNPITRPGTTSRSSA